MTNQESAAPRPMRADAGAIAEGQRPAPLTRLEPDIMTLLQGALAAEGGDARAALAGPVDHFEAATDDASWGCGWRNLQIVASHLLKRSEDFRGALFGGVGFVPDVAGMQAWMEAAWTEGFDPSGAAQLLGNVQGTEKWVGTTDAAALLRLFGVRALLVDFLGVRVPRESSGEPAARQVAVTVKVAGHRGGRAPENASSCSSPRNKGARCAACGGVMSPEEAESQGAVCNACRDAVRGAMAHSPDSISAQLQPATSIPLSPLDDQYMVDHCALVAWIWHYFTDEGKDVSARRGMPTGPRPSKSKPCPTAYEPRDIGGIRLSGQPPLLLQHEGHSRTVVGIERRCAAPGAPSAYSLLLLDPSHPTALLRDSLKEHCGWQRFIKADVDTLSEHDYQVMYVTDGLASASEREQLKQMRAFQQFHVKGRRPLRDTS